jgi:uncharacterized protein YfdQ (DUF2303 family)
MMGETSGRSDAQAIIDAVERNHEVKLLRPAAEVGLAIAAVPKGMELKSVKPFVDEYLKVPERKKGTTTLSTLEAFCEFVNRQKTTDSIVFIDDTSSQQPALLAVFNPHKAETVSKPDSGVGPDHGDHRARYAFPLSDEWKAWKGLPEFIPQDRFASFLEDHIGEVCPLDQVKENVKLYAENLGFQLASPARLLELSRGLALNVNAKVVQVLNLSTGEGQITFAEEHKDSTGAPVKVPGAFGINIPVFRLGSAYNVPVRLRYRAKQDQPVMWSLVPQWLDKVFEHAIDEAQEVIKTRCDLPVYRGAP